MGRQQRTVRRPETSDLTPRPVVASPWRKPDVALAQLDAIRRVRSHATEAIAARMQGVLQTTWVGFSQFARAYFGDAAANDPRPSTNAQEAATTFRALFRELRAMDAR